MSILTKCPKKSESTASRIIENEAVIVVPKEGLVRILNEVGSRIWQLLDGKNSIEDIINILSPEFNVPREGLEKDTLDFIRELKEKEMIILNDEQIT